MSQNNTLPQGMSSVLKKSHLVILGAGFGGIYTYTSLSASIREKYHITIIDKHNHFLFTPLLPEVAGANLDQHSVVESIRDIISKDTKFIQSTVVSVDTEKQVVELADKNISYDVLVSALGSTTHFFGTPGAETNAFTLKDLDDAVQLRNRFIDVFEDASRDSDITSRRKKLTFMIVGAGATGVELAGEVADLFFKTFLSQFSELSTEDIQLILVNGGDSILGIFNEKLRAYAVASLEEDNVIIKNNIRVAEVTESGVITAEGETIDAHTVIWAAGVTANSLTCSCGAFIVERGRIKVDKYLIAENTSNVFIVGDMGLFPTADGRGLPMTAQIAKQQGITTAKNIERLLVHKTMKEFVYKEKGLLASLGSFNAVAQIKGISLTGVVAWFLWRTVYLFNFASHKKRLTIMFEWTINLFTRRDTTRL
jgi:NADH dehydrogenase